MGNSGSKKNQTLLGKKSKKKYGSDDGCIGNRKVRTFTLSIILIVFFAMAASWSIDRRDFYDDFSDSIFGFACGDYCKDSATAWTLIVAGIFCSIAFAVFAILLFFINCDDNVGRVAGVGLIIGGLLYIVGWTWYINLYHDTINYDFLSDDQKERVNAVLAAWFGEALLPSATAILLGVDVFMHLFDSESHRLFWNLANLCFVSCLCMPTYYLNSDLNEDDSWVQVSGLVSSDAYAWIATGYLVLIWITAIYIILYICTCCTCDCKDTACVRLILALGLIAGGVLCCIGYYIYSSDLNDSSLTDSDDTPKYVIYYIGYTILIGGCCFVWALDIGLDDVKGN